MEEWRPIPDHPGYEASSLGRLRSVDRVVVDKNGRPMRYHGTMLRLMPPGRRPYITVHLGDNHSASLHTVVCRTFHGPQPSPKHEVAHWNNDGHDNRAENLRWATRRQNMEDQLRHGTRLNGSKNQKAVLSDKDVIAIRALYATGRMSHEQISWLFNISRPSVTLIVNRVNWKHLP